MHKKTLKVTDIETVLRRLSGAIEMDQIYVDGLPRESFLNVYDDALWRDWRHDHGVFIGKLLASAHAINSAHLERLTEVASSFDPEVIGQIMLEIFAEIVSGSSAAGCETADHFVEWVTGEVVRLGRGKRPSRSAHKSIEQWFSDIDPLTISQDPECGYPLPFDAIRASRVASQQTR
ncbi:hypothetical protein IVB38_34630 [Bradyrhizobium sp. 38]|uniref:hypothetical protein n=1 Tax=unclassified Bradyrhizobium TaxID=2631580 RepID=UPI001FF9C040|nr:MULTISPECIES: hypothetical protein [unclassified Bradyrhizobium]MCK1341017.1 hypothetical protein [Bradyrhizobium sp. 38]MCK1780974.1 hypothetical protein [Bradyrhizobium sp. 132]